jgi:predicted membrane-bound spermidine synthase/cytochrome c-type biogenesis protein CcmH/NrfG
MAAALIYFLFFCSGISGLVYQVVWVREFGTVFGNTIYSSAIVVAIFMLGLGAGSYAAGNWADRRYASAPASLLRVYGFAELMIAALALAVTLALPAVGPLAARSSSYIVDAGGWFELSSRSYVARGVIALGLLGPVTLLMGATLTLLVRHLVNSDVESAGGWRIAWLYGVNTIGAAAGAFLTDYLLVPVAGLRTTQLIAVTINVIAGVGALTLTVGSRPARVDRHAARKEATAVARWSPTILWTCAALALSGFAVMGIEIVWLRHFTLLLGSFRSVFSLVITVVLVGIGLGSLLGALINRALGRPAETLIALLALFVSAVLAGLAFARFPFVDDVSSVGWSWTDDLWHNLQPTLREAGLPSLLIGGSFPLGNALIQHAEAAVGRRAGVLYLANTIGAVAGSLVAGFVLLPVFGMQASGTVLMLAAAFAIVPLALTLPMRRAVPVIAVSFLVVAGAFGGWLRLAPDHVLRLALAPPLSGQRSLSVREGVNEVIEVTEAAGRGRGLITNGHPMSSTAWLDQRYMRALAHVPLLSMDGPTRVLVIGFGVGNSTHAAALHSSIERIDVVDLSRGVLEHAGYFRDVNSGVLADRRVHVFVNDGRQHLQMSGLDYDLITLEPPPIAHAGVAELYSKEFYELARGRLKPGGYLSQWLPAYQVPAETSLAMVRAFVDVFPQSVLLSGMGPELLLVGTTASTISIDPVRVARTLEREPRVLADLRRLDLGTPTEIVGMFVGSARTLARATTTAREVSDDWPLQEYGVRSAAAPTGGVPASLFDVGSVAAWCPRCFDNGRPAASVPSLDMYLALLDNAYRTGAQRASSGAESHLILGSRYLGDVVPDTDAVQNIIGVMFLRERRYSDAMTAFGEALARNADSIDANRNMAAALADTGQTSEAVGYLRHAVRLDPGNATLQYELGRLLLDRREFGEASTCFRTALQSMPGSSSLHNDLGVALASSGDLADAIEQFRQAVALDPAFDEARRNLASAERASAGSSAGSARSSS